MPTSGPILAAMLLAVEEAEAAAEVAEPEPEPAVEAVEVAMEVADAELAAAEEVVADEGSLDVALRVPQVSAFLQFCWPSASLGWSLMHWL